MSGRIHNSVDRRCQSSLDPGLWRRFIEKSPPPPPTTLPPTIAKVFGSAGINLGGSTILTFNLANPNSSLSLSGVGFTDPLPSGLLVSSPTEPSTGNFAEEAQSMLALARVASVRVWGFTECRRIVQLYCERYG